MPVLRKPGLESADAEEARTDRTGTLASRDPAASAGCHAPDAGDSADTACAEEEIEITEAMIEAGLSALESELCEDYLTDLSKPRAVRKVWAAMKQLAP
jgi:hypothetical protein